MDAPDHGFPVVVIGGSAGALEPLQRIARLLPSRFPAAVCVVMHTPRDSVSALPHLLNRAGPLFATHAIDRAPLAPGSIVVAPPDMHLAIEDGLMRVVPGPAENNSRPSIDVLFRSAAASFGNRACAVLLSGVLDDGVAGMATVHEAGGATFVQSPDDAYFPDMPLNALRTGIVDAALPADEVVAAIEKWIQSGGSRPAGIRTAISKDERQVGAPSVFTCPDCGGTLWEVDDAGLMRFRCRVGHAYSTSSMVQAQGDALEAALWSAVRTLQERHNMLSRLAERARDSKNTVTFRRLERKADEVRNEMERLQSAIVELSSAIMSPPDSGEIS